MIVLVTGANGFVGAPLCRRLLAGGHRVIAAVRAGRAAPPGTEARVIADLGPDTDWTEVLAGVDAVVHVAARVHVMRDTAADPLALYRAVNRDATVRLAAQAAALGVKRFIFVSSITVNGEETALDRPFTAADRLRPQSPYAVSKLEAEAALRDLAPMVGLKLTILRPPLVHGPGAKGNLAALAGLIGRGVPLPVGCIRNRRSMIGVVNLADAIAFCLGCDATIGDTFLVKDGQDISVPDLIARVGRILGRAPMIVPVPVWMMALAGRLLGKSAVVRRLTGSLWVDDGPLRALGWHPPLTLDEGLAEWVALKIESEP